MIDLQPERKEPVFSKCVVLTSNALLFQLGALVLAGGVFLLVGEWSELDSDTIKQIQLTALIIGGLWVCVSMFGCCTLTCRLRKLEYLFLFVVCLTTAATAFSIYQLDNFEADIDTDAPTLTTAVECTAGQEGLTRSEADLRDNFNDLYVKFQADNEKYQFFYDWYTDNCGINSDVGSCQCQEVNEIGDENDGFGDGTDEAEQVCGTSHLGYDVKPTPTFETASSLCVCCDPYLCCQGAINEFVVSKLTFLRYGFYGLSAIQGMIILGTFYHIWNTVDGKPAGQTLELGRGGPRREIDLRNSEYARGSRTYSTTAHNREVLRRASQEGPPVVQAVEMGMIAPKV